MSLKASFIKRLSSWALIALFISTLLVSVFPAQPAYAANETFRWSATDNAIIDVTGGDLQPSTMRTGNFNGNSFSGIFRHNSNCQFSIQLRIDFNGAGNLYIQDSIGDGSLPAGVTTPCNFDNIVRPYINQPVQVTGTRAAGSVETNAQKSVIINLYSSKPSSQSPATVTFTVKKTDGTVVATATAPKENVLQPGDTPDDDDRPVQYILGSTPTGELTLLLDPGMYQVCFSDIIAECQTFQKVIYVPFRKTYGTQYVSPNVNDAINVKVELKYSMGAGNEKTVGPINLSLLTAEGNQNLKSASTGTYTHEGCDPGDLTPTPICQVQGQPQSSTTYLNASFADVEPGNYKVCITGTEICANVTKVLGADASVTLTADGSIGQALADGQVAGQGTTGTPDPLCDEKNSGGLGWFFCSIGQAILDAVRNLDHWILRQLEINTDAIFVDGGAGSSGRAFRQAWSIFRNIAYALFIILGLVMIISQIMGLDIFDAYTIRKMLPKLVAAAIFIPLIWPILKLLFEMSNNAGSAVYELILAPFGGVGNAWSLEKLFLTSATVGGVGVAAFFAVGGWGVFLAVMASILLALLSALVILAVRDIVAYALIIASPVAIICATFEPFKKVFTLWKTFLLTILLAIPAISAVLAASKVAAKISIETSDTWGVLLGAVFLAAGYALFWKIFQALDKVSGQVGNLIGNVTGKAQKALSEYRGDTLKKRWEAGIEGRRNLGFFGAGNMFTNLGRRARMTDEAGLGAWGVGKKGRAKYGEAVKTMQAHVASKMMEQDKDRAGGDDDAMRLLARRGMTESRFLKEYAEMQRAGGATEEQARERARQALGLSQTSLGARAGTSAMRIAAQRSLLKSNTSYGKGADGKYLSYGEMTRQVYGDVAELVNDGLITVADGAAMIKSNAARADRAGVGFGMSIKQLDRVARQGVGALDTAAIEDMANDALRGTGPYQLAGQRHEAMGILAPEMTRRIQQSWDQKAWDERRELSPAFIQQIAAAASRRDMAAQFPELNAGLNAEGVEGMVVGGGLSTQQWEEFLRSGASSVDQATFQRYRREYTSAYASQMGQPPTPGGPTAGIPAAGGG